MKFLGKKILIISPESWGINMLSKHHYALSLARLGNSVYFLNPPEDTTKGVQIEGPDEHGVVQIHYKPLVKGINRLPGVLADIFSKQEIRRIKKKANVDFDVVWNFDAFRFQNLKLFNAKISIFHAVDFVSSPLQKRSAKNSDIVLSVSQPILKKLASSHTPSFFINHGLSDFFVYDFKDSVSEEPHTIKCGYVGNLLSTAIHWSILFRIIAENPAVEFHMIGPYTNSNIGNARIDSEFIVSLRAFPNVVLHGEMTPNRVAEIIVSFDLFLICYNHEKVGDVVSNTHKIIEFLSTGKVIVSSRISTYDDLAPPLFQMVRNSEELPASFSETIAKLAEFNNKEHRQARIDFALQNTYTSQIQRIENLITHHLPGR